ncbi:MAG: two-component regulator propeller domain-containing protein [Bacteroidota bacterium]
MKNIFLTVAVFMGFSLQGQTPAYLHYSVEDGLPSTMVYCAVQDQRGFIWFGTNNGLARFDGSRFKTYDKEDGLPDPEVLKLYEDRQGRLWISCFQQNPCFLKDGVFHTSDNDSSLAQLDIKEKLHHFFEPADESIWILGRKNYFDEICVVTQSESTCHPFAKSAQGGTKHIVPPKLKEITPEVVDFLNNEYLQLYSTPNFNSAEKQAKKYPYSKFWPLVSDTLSTSLIYQGNNFKKVSFHYLSVINEENKTFEIPNADNTVNLIDNGNIWLTYPQSNDGIYKVNYATNAITNYLGGKQTSRICKDRENNFWFLTLNEGIYSLPEKHTTIYDKSNTPSFISDNITAILLINEKDKLIGDATGNIYKYKNGTWALYEYKTNSEKNRIRHIIPYSNKDWLAVTDNILFAEIDGKIQPFNGINLQRDPKDRWIGSPKYALVNDGNTYLGSMTGLNIWSDPEKKPLMLNAFNRVSAVGVDSENNIWIGGNDGLLSLKDSFQIQWGEQFGQLAGRIIDIKPAGPNQLWVVTAENDLVRARVKDGKVTAALAMNDTLPIPIKNIKHLHKSSDGTLWISTNTGVFGLGGQPGILHFDATDGLPSDDVNAVAVENDTLWAATTAGLAKIQLNRTGGKGDFSTYISAVSYELNKANVHEDLVYRKQGKVVIPQGASRIDIQLSGLHYGSAGNFVFEYIEEEQLLPLQWVTWSNLSSNLAKLFSGKADTTLLRKGNRYFGAHVPKGNFRTTVTAIAKDGTRSLYPDTRTFTILPYWYETIWFSLFIIGFSAYAVWLFLRQYTRAKRFQRAASELQLAAIKAQVNPHFVGNSINAIQQFFYPPDPGAASRYIATFTSLLRQTMHLSEVPFVPFEEELSFITDYLKMVKLRFGERFEYQVVEKDNIPKGTLFPAMILQPILENATIHGFAPEGTSRLSSTFELREGKLVCTITDNGVGIEKSKKIKKNQNRKRVSRGIQLLQDKINVMNKMYGLDLRIGYLDLSSINKNRSGTQVTLSYTPGKIAT